MAYTTPRTWVAGEIVDKDMMNEQVRDNIAYLKNLADDNAQNINGLDGRIRDVENTLDELDVPDIGDLESRFGVNETDIGLLDERVTATETNIGTINNTTLKTSSLNILNYFNGTSFVRSRAHNTVYQNTSGKIRFVVATVWLQEANIADLAAHVSSTNLPSTPPVGQAATYTPVMYYEFPIRSGYHPFSFIVPPNYYYVIYSYHSPENNDKVFAGSWTEYDLF